MSITGALSGFAIAAIIVGIIGAIATAVSLIDTDERYDRSKRMHCLAFFIILFFIGAIIAGGVG